MHNTPAPAANISSFLAERIEAGDFPSAVYLIAERGQVIFADAVGHAVLEPYRITATLDTIYDLASLTKPLVTTLLCARRIESGELTLDAAVGHYLTEFDRTDKQGITVKHLLTHSSGLPAWRPLYILTAGEPDRTLGQLANEPLEYAPGTRVVYSDLGFITLGILLERISGKTLRVLAQEEIFGPLKLEHTFFNPELARQTGIAACESGNLYEQNTVREAGLEYDKWRQRIIWGEVHDGNAYFLGGSAGHAGLFSTAHETFLIANQFLSARTSFFKPETCELFSMNLTKGLEEARSIGWQLAVTAESTASTAMPPNSFGHTGFTGTSCWIDPNQERIYLLLTNRTHARSLPFVNINSVRRKFHTMAVTALDNQRG